MVYYLMQKVFKASQHQETCLTVQLVLCFYVSSSWRKSMICYPNSILPPTDKGIYVYFFFWLLLSVSSVCLGNIAMTIKLLHLNSKQVAATFGAPGGNNNKQHFFLDFAWYRQKCLRLDIGQHANGSDERLAMTLHRFQKLSPRIVHRQRKNLVPSSSISVELIKTELWI